MSEGTASHGIDAAPSWVCCDWHRQAAESMAAQARSLAPDHHHVGCATCGAWDHVAHSGACPQAEPVMRDAPRWPDASAATFTWQIRRPDPARDGGATT